MATAQPGRAAVGALVAAGVLAATGPPMLRTATASGRHVVAVFTIGDLRPWMIEVASSPAIEVSGAFLPRAVRLRETIRGGVDPTTGLARVRTRKALPSGRYYVRVSGVESDGVTDCLPQLPGCLVHWSNTRSVLIR